MSLIKKYGVIIFAILLLLHCAFIYIGETELRTISKFLLIPFLVLYLLAATSKTQAGYNLPAYAGLFFAFLGDVLLSRSGEQFFLFGMLAFIGTHISNSIYFLKIQKLDFSKGRPMLFAAIILLIISSEVMSKTASLLEDFKVPIMLYMAIISVMAILAANTINHTQTKQLAVRFFIPGAGFFVLSDALLALNKFLYHEPSLDILVMLTYGAAQCLLVMGFSRRGANS